ncbi:MAG: copper homeostasis protein CutC, partial [Flavobacteriaceae bacterium]|nr:copper homeostasis protein CutC [Bacteroidia bacterium]NNL61266.1 copper homeostasis protein CutC [Flavobacteriaceae bacterium]
NAENGGVHRIELCENLAVGGLTPSYSLIKKVIEELSIPVNILVRPREGNFVYNDEEFNKMKKDIEFCKRIGCHGIVSGILYDNGSIDIARTGELIELSRPMYFTFHRAFDIITDPLEALSSLMELGVDRILTSGHEETALQGIALLKELKDTAKDKLTIIAGGSIRSSNIVHFKNAGFKEVHSSALLDRSEHSDVNEIRKLMVLVEN